MPRSWTDEQLIKATAEARSYAEVARKLNLKATGGTYKTIKAHIDRLKLVTDHFKGQAWNSGSQYRAPKVAQAIENILVATSSFTSSYHLKRRLLKEGMLEYRCHACGKTEVHNPFLDKMVPVPLELDHINGDNRDNRIENLRLLDPICHAFTDTYRGKNKPA